MKLPNSAWAKNKALRSAGHLQALGLETGYHAYGMALFTRILGMSEEEANKICDEARDAGIYRAKKEKVHDYSYLFVPPLGQQRSALTSYLATSCTPRNPSKLGVSEGLSRYITHRARLPHHPSTRREGPRSNISFVNTFYISRYKIRIFNYSASGFRAWTMKLGALLVNAAPMSHQEIARNGM